MPASEALRQEATHDGLTGLLNRRAILGLLQIELERANRESRPLSVLMVDLDQFKQVNDEYGHLTGDAVLREATDRMRSSVRTYDSIGRYGGEEFLIVLPGCHGEGALAQAQRTRLALASQAFSAGQHSLPITCSIGVAWRPVSGLADTDTLIREADLALYGAKASGRNCVVCACVETVVLH